MAKAYLNLRFSNWTEWANRTDLPGTSHPGVYLLAHFKKQPPPGPANPQAQEIVYIGETSRNLLGRWAQFHRSAFDQKDGHSGGLTYGKKFPNRQPLFIAALAVDYVADDMRPLFIRYVERKAIWEYAQKWGNAPTCNRK